MDNIGDMKRNEQDAERQMFKHILYTWIANDTIIKAIISDLGHQADLFHLISLLDNDDVINSIKNRKDGTKIVIQKHTAQRIKAIPSFVAYIQNNTQSVLTGIADISQFTRDDLIGFSQSHRGKVTYDSIQATNSEATQAVETHMPLEIRRNVKSLSRSIGYEFSAFPTLVSSTTEAFITYDRELRTRCHVLGLTHVLEEGKTPHKNDNVFMYGVFLYTLSTPKAKDLLTAYSVDMNGQRVYIELKEYYTGQHSIILRHRMQSLFSSLHSTVPKSYSSHILADLISEWLMQFDELNAISGHTISRRDKLAMLEHYISPVDELREVVGMQGMLSLMNGPSVDITDEDVIIDLYYRQALIVDSANKSRIIQDRQSLVQELLHIQSTWTEHGYDCIDINATNLTSDSTTDDEYYIEYLRSLRGYNPTMPKKAWQSLTPGEKSQWDTFSEEAKAIILGSRAGFLHPHHRTRALAPAQPPISSPSPPTVRFVDNHDVAQSTVQIADFEHDFLSAILCHFHNLDPRSSEFVDAMCDDQAALRETFQTSHLPPFTMSRFMSQTTTKHNRKRQQPTKASKPSLLTPSQMSTGPTSSRTDTLLTPSTLRDPDSIRDVNSTTISYDDDSFRGCYRVSAMRHSGTRRGLMDRGANGSLAGINDVRVISLTGEHIDVQGIDNHTLNKIPLGTVGCVVQSQRGDVLLICHQYAVMGRGKTIHSCIQWEAFGNTVNEKSIQFGGTQSVTTPCGYRIPLDIVNGLAYLNSRPFTDDEFDTCPHVHITCDMHWQPSRLDSVISLSEDWYNDQDDPLPPNPSFSLTGEYLESNLHDSIPSTSEAVSVDFTHDDASMYDYLSAYICHTTGITIDARITKKHIEDCSHLRRFLLNVPADVVQHTLDATTRLYRVDPSRRIRRTYRSHYPAHNVNRRSEAVASDTFFFDIDAWGGIKCCQFFIGRRSLFMSVHGMKTDGEFVNALEDEIRKRGAMEKIITDCAKAEISKRVKDILRNLYIDDYQSEPHHQNQNIAERYIQEAKKHAHWVLNTSGAPPESVMLVLEYITYIWNRTAKRVIGWRTPCEAMTGDTPDISNMLLYRFWQPVYIADVNSTFPSSSSEIMCRFAGFSESIGNSMCFKVYNEETGMVLHRSEIRIAEDDDATHRANPNGFDPNGDASTNDPSPNPVFESTEETTSDNDEQGGHVPTDQADIPCNDSIIHSRLNADGSPSRPAIISPDVIDDIIGRTFLMAEEEDGTRRRGKVVELITKFENERDNRPEHIKFKCVIGDEEYEKVVAYNEMVNFIEEQEMNENGTWNFREIKGHSKVSDRKVAMVLVEWESGEVTWEPVRNMMKTNPWLIAEYAINNGLVELWSERYPSLKLHRYTKNAKKVIRMVNEAKRKSYKNSPVYMYGHQVPRNHEQAVELDLANGNTKWQDSEKLERDQLWEYNTFDDRGHKSKATLPGPGYKKITLHFVYAVKHDGRYKSRIVAGGHLTDAPIESVYSGVVSLRGVRFVIFLAELNELEVWQTDVGNAYLEAYTKEKVFVIAGPEFAEREGNLLVIVKALYGLKSSGLRWHDRFAQVLRQMQFFPCPAEPEIWMRACNKDGSVIPIDGERFVMPTSTTDSVPSSLGDGSYYEYIAVYCDDLTIASRDPEAITRTLEGPEHSFKLKGTGPLSFLLGCDYFYDDEGLLCFAPKKYIEKMELTYRQMFGEKPKGRPRSPLESGDNPELDTSEFLKEDDIKKYQSMIGAAQWVINLGRFDIAVHVMSMSSFRVQPRVGHLSRMKRIYSYLLNYNNSVIRIRTELPDVLDFNFFEYDWSNSPYAGAREDIPSNLPNARGKPVLMTSFVDANLYHDALSGKSVTGVLHFLNKTPLDWFSKKQNTVETATFGSENNAARAAIEQIRANKQTLMYLGVPLAGPPILLGDNESVVNSGTHPHGKLHKRHLMLSYHFVRENIAAGALRFAFVSGASNPADVLSKHWAHPAVYPLLKPILFTKGDTLKDATDDNDYKSNQTKS